MTFLENVIERLLGEPVSRNGNRSSWRCPSCARGVIMTRTPNPRYKDRVDCNECDFRGDEFDVMRAVHTGETFGDRKARLEKWRVEFEALNSSPENGAGEYRPPAGYDYDGEAMDSAFCDILKQMRKARKAWAKDRPLDRMRAAVYIVAVADSHSVPVEALMSRCARYLIDAKKRHQA